MAERAAGGDWGPPAAPCRLSAPQPRASNLRPTSPWISRRSSLILRIARAHAGLRGSQLILLISELAHEGAQFHTNPRFRTQACDDHPDIQMMHLGEPPRAELVIRVVPGPASYLQDNGGLGRAVLVGLFTARQVDHPLPEAQGNETCGLFPLNLFFPSVRTRCRGKEYQVAAWRSSTVGSLRSPTSMPR